MIVASKAPGLEEGTRVAYVADHAYAELTAVPADNVVPIPDGLTTQTAAAAQLQGLTALTFVREVAGLAPPHSPASQLGVSEGPW